MNYQNILRQWSPCAPYFHSLLRIVAAILFIFPGTMKLFAFPMGMPPDGSTAILMSQIWFGGFLEIVGGGLMLIGLFTRPVAFILSGEMAVAYFQFHAPQGLLPIQNGGAEAILYCFLWFYFSAAGAGVWSVDNLIQKK